MVLPLSKRFRCLTVALAIVGLLYSFGVCPGGCLEENHWYALAHHLVDHNDDLPACAHEDPTEHCDCEVEPDSAVLVSSRSIDLAPLALLELTAPFDIRGLFQPAPVVACVPLLSQRASGPTATLRAQCQLFRC